mgnify:CR=1 FL=1
MKTVYLFLATGFEEIEALTIVDMLRRAEIDITTVSISRNLQVEGAHGITVTADCTWVELSTEDADWLILPGGTKHLGECKPLVSLLQRQAAANKNIAAICAAPSVLGQAGLLNGYKATCYPGFEQFLTGATVTGDNVTVDRNITTGKGPGAAISFATAIITQIAGEEKAREVTSGMLL